ncbi:hypothetical protein X975_06059, partial [Stegodyphus mimosarum]
MPSQHAGHFFQRSMVRVPAKVLLIFQYSCFKKNPNDSTSLLARLLGNCKLLSNLNSAQQHMDENMQQK